MRELRIVLAAGDGTRLQELTTRNGIATPKQYCSLRGGGSLLGDALARAARCVPRKRVLVVVAEEHRRFWERELVDFPAENVVVQPRNRGTAAGILLPLMRVLEQGGKFVQSIKYGCELAGLPAGPVRKPLRALDKAQKRELEITIRTLKATVARIVNEPAKEGARNVVALNA